MKKLFGIILILTVANSLTSMFTFAETLDGQGSSLGNEYATESSDVQFQELGGTTAPYTSSETTSEPSSESDEATTAPEQSPETDGAGGLVGLAAAGAVAAASISQKRNRSPSLSQNAQQKYDTVKNLLSQKDSNVDQIRNTMSSLTPDEANNVGKALNEEGLYIPGLVGDAPSAEDATSRLKTLYMGTYDEQDPQKGFIRDMAGIAKKEGFKITLQVSKNSDTKEIQRRLVNDSEDIKSEDELSKVIDFVKTPTDGYLWAEDNKWLSSDGRTLTTSSDLDPKVSAVFDKTKAFAVRSIGLKPSDPNFALEGSHSVGLEPTDPNNVVEEESFQGAVARRTENKSAAQLATATNKQLKITRTYNEGGNMVVGVKPNGQPYALIGRDGLLASTFLLEEKYKKNPSTVPEFAPAAINKKINSMTFDQTTLDQTASRLSSAGVLDYPQPPVDQAKAFLAKMEITKQIMADEISVPLDSIAFISQPEFHIDMHMRPLAPGRVMLNDENENQKLIKSALQRTTQGSWEESELKNMLDYSKTKDPVTKPVTDLIERQIRSIGVDVVRAPGVIDGKSSSGNPRHVNFMNALPGTSNGTNQQFYITNYTSIAPLRDSYEAYIKSQGMEKVYWVGKSGGGPESLSDSESSLVNQGGLDCRENH